MSRVMKMKKGYRHLFCGLAAILLSFTVVFLTRYFMADTIVSYYEGDMVMPENSRSVLESAELVAVRSTLEGNYVHMEGDDPQLRFYLSEEEATEIHTVALLLGEAFKETTVCALYYPDETGEYEKDSVVVVELAAGNDRLFFHIPEEADYVMTQFRVDIDGDYLLEDVLISEGVRIGEYDFRGRYRRKAWAAYSVVLFLIFEGLCFLWNNFRDSLMDYWKKRKDAGKLLLLLAGAAGLGNVAVFLLLRLSGKNWSWFWGILIGFCSAISVYQIRLLRKPGGAAPVLPLKGNSGFRRELLYWAGIFLFIFLIAFEWKEGRESIGEGWGLTRFQFPFAFAIVEVVLLAMLFRKYIFGVREEAVSFLNSYLFVLVLLGLGYMLVFLPDISPDESRHYLASYRVANVFLGKIGQWGDNRLLMRAEDYALLSQMEESPNGEYYNLITEGYRLFAGESGMVIVDGPMVTNAMFSYWFTGVGIALARIFHLSGIMTFHAGRFGNLLVFVFVLRYLMRKIPFGRTALFAVAMMPMTLHMAASYSYDAMTFCYVALFVVQVMCMIVSHKKISPGDFHLCILYGILMAPSKLIYLPLLFLVLLVPWENLGDSRREGMKKMILVIGAGFISALIVTIVANLSSSGAAVRTVMEQDATLSWTAEPGYTISWILSNPWEYVLMCVRTLVLWSDYYLFTMIGTRLGWLDVGIPYSYAVLSFVLFLLAVNIRDDVSAYVRIGWGKKCWIFLLCAGTMFIILAAMTVSWTEASSNYIQGVQGRYLLPLLIPVIWVCRNDLIRVDSVIRKHIVFLSVMLNLWILVYVFTRYICVV